MRVTIAPTIPEYYHGPLRALLALGFTGVADARIEVHVKARRGRAAFSGRAYQGVPDVARVAATTDRLVTLHIPPDPDVLDDYPHDWSYPGMKSAPTWTFATWQEEFLHLVVHEASHYRQAAVRAKRANGRAKQSEIWAERWTQRQMAKLAPRLAALVAL